MTLGNIEWQTNPRHAAPALHAAYRFTLRVNLQSLLGERSPDLAAREIAGGTRIFFQYQGTAQTEVRGAELAETNFTGRSTNEAAPPPPRARTRSGGSGPPPPAPFEHLGELLEKARAYRATNDDAATEAAAVAGDLARALGIDVPGAHAPANEQRAAVRPVYVATGGETSALEEIFESKQLWGGLNGDIVTSGDWALFRNDGQLVLDARFTIKSSDDDSLIAVRLSGMADLASVYQRAGSQAYLAWLQGERPPENAQPLVPLSATMRLDVPVPLVDKLPIAAKRYVRACEYSWKYGRLSRGTMIGSGDVHLDLARGNRDMCFVDRFTLNVFEII